MSVTGIGLRDFMVFKDITIEFADGLNIFTGENGTGKTHLLKILLTQHNNEKIIQGEIFHNKGYAPDLERMFQDGKGYVIKAQRMEKDCIYIPVKDMLTHSKGFTAMYNKYLEFPFDKTLSSIIDKAQRWKVAQVPDLALKIVDKLEAMLEGKVVIENDDFYVKKENGLMVKFDVEAEGLKKIGLLWQLLMNESISKDSILLWDEPEANLNPKFISDLVEILLELSRNGVQIFLTTHSYIFAKYFEVRRKSNDEMLFHSLYKTENDGVLCESNKNFKDLSHNTIMSSFEKLLDEVYEQNVGG